MFWRLNTDEIRHLCAELRRLARLPIEDLPCETACPLEEVLQRGREDCHRRRSFPKSRSPRSRVFDDITTTMMMMEIGWRNRVGGRSTTTNQGSTGSHMTRRDSDDTTHLEEALEVVDLAERHGNQHQRLEERPQHNARVGVVVDSSMNPLSDFHVLLFVFHSSQCA